MRESYSIAGVITTVQESRFRLRTDNGWSKLLVLASNAALDPADLVPLKTERKRISVTVSDLEDRTAAAIAHAIEAEPLPGLRGSA